MRMNPRISQLLNEASWQIYFEYASQTKSCQEINSN